MAQGSGIDGADEMGMVPKLCQSAECQCTISCTEGDLNVSGNFVERPPASHSVFAPYFIEF